MEEQDSISYDDLAEIKKSRKFPLRLLLIVIIVVLVLGGGAYAYLNGMIPFLPSLAQITSPDPAAAEETPVVEETEVTAVAGETTEKAEPTDTSAPTEETPAPTEEAPAEAPAADKLYPPEFGTIAFTRATTDGEWDERANKMAANMAIAEPFDWEYLELTPETRKADVRAYYVQLLNKDMGFRMTFEETYADNGFSIFKFKQEGRRVTIQFWESQPNKPPALIIFYEGW